MSQSHVYVPGLATSLLSLGLPGSGRRSRLRGVSHWEATLLEGPLGRPWARLDLSLDTTLFVTGFSDSTGVEDDPGYRKCSLSTSNISLTKTISVLNSVTIPKSNIFLTA